MSARLFWSLLLLLWGLSTLWDRLWLGWDQRLPSWDQADYLNSALDHAHALSLFGGNGASDFGSFLDKSPKIPPLASIISVL